MLIDAFLGIDRIAAAIVQRELHAPITVDVEVLHALRKGWVAGRISAYAAESVIAILAETEIVRHPVDRFLPRMWSIRHNVSSYDAGYVALAESLNLPLLTRDRRLSQSSGHTARIEYID
ncbi:MAG TPA: type II toxin-antitoxin system VapC family toxin [Thermoanaerobaculia bacterium]